MPVSSLSNTAAAIGSSPRSAIVRFTRAALLNDGEAVLAIPVAYERHSRALPGEPFAEAARRLGCGVGMEADDLRVVDHQPHRLTVMMLVLGGDVHDDA